MLLVTFKVMVFEVLHSKGHRYSTNMFELATYSTKLQQIGAPYIGAFHHRGATERVGVTLTSLLLNNKFFNNSALC
ncbi:hypothetical protein BCU70_11875 [Vibrio sp. 10N.286.49.C2]|nr:hypothetical protein BCU70_11875 [Vibrio sp. 10N.286.49.C2]PMH79249.1 hypothetical protein BCU58_06115 [Vibrio sp. 10N.286.48.B7]